MRFTAFCLVAVALVSGCDGGTRLKGEVRGPDGQPIAGAQVRLDEAEDYGSETTTDEAGRFELGRVHAPFDIRLVFRVTKEGFRPYRQEFRSHRREDVPSLIVLQPEQRPPQRPKE
jgi:hypothetical protein